MNLTQIDFDEIKKQVRYDSETGHFYYLSDRYLERRFKEPLAVPKPLKLAHKADDRADKIYGKGRQFVGVYVVLRGKGVVINAAHIALLLHTGHWPEAVAYKTGDWGDISIGNLIPRTRSDQTTQAALSRYEGFPRKLPRNVYSTSGGWFIGRKGKLRTKEYESVREVEQAIRLGRWLA